jgi:hypothetical protein
MRTSALAYGDDEMSISNYLELELLDHVIKGDSYSAPAEIYISLHSGDPGETGASELSGDGYARIAARADFGTVASSGSISNDGAVEFAAASGGDWTEATHFGCWDALTNGNFLWGGALTDAKTVQDGDTASFAIGALTFSLD